MTCSRWSRLFVKAFTIYEVRGASGALLASLKPRWSRGRQHHAPAGSLMSHFAFHRIWLRKRLRTEPGCLFLSRSRLGPICSASDLPIRSTGFSIKPVAATQATVVARGKASRLFHVDHPSANHARPRYLRRGRNGGKQAEVCFLNCQRMGVFDGHEPFPLLAGLGRMASLVRGMENAALFGLARS